MHLFSHIPVHSYIYVYPYILFPFSHFTIFFLACTLHWLIQSSWSVTDLVRGVSRAAKPLAARIARNP